MIDTPPHSYMVDYVISERDNFHIYKSTGMLDIAPIYGYILSNHKEMITYLNLDISDKIDAIVLAELIKIILDTDSITTPNDIYMIYVKLENNIYLSYSGDIVIDCGNINKYVIEYTKSLEKLLIDIIANNLGNKHMIRGDMDIDAILDNGDFFVMDDVDIHIRGANTNMILKLTIYEFAK